MFCYRVNDQTELQLIDRQYTESLFKLIEANREHIRQWHPWVDAIRAPAAVERAIINWQQQYTNNRGFYAAIRYQGRFCGVINHLNVDWANRWTALGYWLDAGHQGKGIMTACCRTLIEHSFNVWKLNRVTIECATENTRSRAIPERLGFKLEGVARQIEWVHDRFVDHAMYSLLRSELPPGQPKAGQDLK
jgi:ribosomal-protein-serine acetyltransferase